MLDAILGVITGIAVAVIIIAWSLRTANLETKATNADLLNRLAARSYGEYAAFQGTVPQEAPFDSGRRLVYDDTGLLEAEVPND